MNPGWQRIPRGGLVAVELGVGPSVVPSPVEPFHSCRWSWLVGMGSFGPEGQLEAGVALGV